MVKGKVAGRLAVAWFLVTWVAGAVTASSFMIPWPEWLGVTALIILLLGIPMVAVLAFVQSRKDGTSFLAALRDAGRGAWYFVSGFF